MTDGDDGPCYTFNRIGGLERVDDIEYAEKNAGMGRTWYTMYATEWEGGTTKEEKNFVTLPWLQR